MPIKIPAGLPAHETMERENIFVMTELRAEHQDIRPLKIAVLNLMPTKITTETQLIRLLSNSSLQIELTLLQTASHVAKHTSAEHMEAFYKNYYDIKHEKFDGLIITGAPVENLDFGDVDYWPELCEVMEWSKTHVFSTLHICWAAQAGLYYHYGVPKYPLDKKMFGVFEHSAVNPNHPIVRGFDEIFMAPHSRHTEVREEDILKVSELDLVAKSELAGPYIIAAKNARMLFVTGHSEYDFDTLANEYFRDVGKGLPIEQPLNYFPGGDTTKRPPNVWRGHANLLFTNWLNYFVYQNTPYDLADLS
ncbi:MAG: homoserine O-succinyltransferase [Ruminococcaceae bacterium]|nr:homoserine O-succinyltransferase [Oscillospiraceae bacterium]